MNNKEFLSNLLQTNDVSVIQDVITNNPYFEAAHIAKALHSKDPNDLHNASVLLQNELWMQYLLSQNEVTSVENTQSNIIVKNDSNEDSLVNNKITEILIPVSTTENEISANATTAQPNIVENEEEKFNVEENFEKTIVTNEFASNLETKETINEHKLNETSFENGTFDADNTNFDPSFENEAIAIPLADANSLKSIFSDIKNKKTDENSANDQLPISIEPFHTIDYFASQGIKVPLINTNDKLSVQLKSFTQWLKTMKKVEVSTTNSSVEELQQHTNVVAMAEGSLIKNDILTENMVEVLVKQGKTNEAIVLLQKLSLQDTTKSVYFASRIEQLKKY